MPKSKPPRRSQPKLPASSPPPHGGPPFTTLGSEVVFSTTVFRVERLRRRSGLTGAEVDAYRLHGPDWVNVVALTPGGDVVLVRQERHGTLAPTLEIPGGCVDPGEEPAAAAVRELAEETGYRGRPPKLLGWVHPNPAIQGNRCHTFLVRDAVPAGPPAPDDGEELSVEVVPLAAVRERVRRGEITHALVVAALYFLDAAHPPERRRRGKGPPRKA